MLRLRTWWPLYAGWIALCAVLFFALSGLEDPSRPRGRLLSVEAGRLALQVVPPADLAPADLAPAVVAPTFSRGGQTESLSHTTLSKRGYTVVHVARARAGEGAAEDRWIVLLDKDPHTRLKEAVVVELAVDSGKILRTRRPPR